MPRTTRTNRRSGNGFPPEYARSLGIDDLPSGARGSDAEPQPWRRRRERRLVDLVTASRIVQRWADVIPARRG